MAQGTVSHQVVIAGGGPTGMTLAAELKLAGIDVAIVERRVDPALVGARAGGLHARTLEIFDQRGIAERFVREGQKGQGIGFAGLHFDLSGFPSRYNFTLGLWQMHTERILLGWVGELGVEIHRGVEVTGFTQDDTGVDVALSDGRSLRAQYLVGCDGGRSLVRKAAGIDFPGSDPTTSNIIAEVEMIDTPPLGMQRTAHGIHGFGRLDYEIVDGQIVYKDTGPIRVMVTEPTVGGPGEPTLAELSDILRTVCGTDYGVHSPRTITRFTDAARQAATYRRGRVLVAGDAAHIHPPDGGQGLNTGVQDAVNLGWKLAQVLKGISPDSLLDTYHAERHPVGARVLRWTLAAVTLRRDDDRTRALRDTMAELLGFEAPRKHLAADLSELGIAYDLGAGHPLLGRRMPDLDIVAENGPLLVYELLHDARPLLLNLGVPGALDIAGWSDRVRLVDATYDGDWDLPALGVVASPGAVLVRPDGYVAWVGDGTPAGLAEALEKWCGSPRQL
ncbi:MAG TPA: FAD-dependent monooxygenase [Devosia sp.]|nr:FAD-dependent monooxygenase [Devosia sp.]